MEKSHSQMRREKEKAKRPEKLKERENRANRKSYWKNPEKHRERSRQWVRNNPEKYEEQKRRRRERYGFGEYRVELVKCKKCTIPIDTHPRCERCEILFHGNEDNHDC